MLQKGKKQLAVLIDPDKFYTQQVQTLVEYLVNTPPTFIFIGGSITSNSTDKVIEELRLKVSSPIILFPGSATQFSAKADALLFLSLISGRNSDYLIGQHVVAASSILQSGIKTIPVGYMLIESGSTTSVEYISNTKPIPRNKIDIALATAVAGQLLGLKSIYLEAGSGADMPVPSKMIKKISETLSVPLIVGGGLRSLSDVQAAFLSGADIVVIGNALENNPQLYLELIQTLA